MRPWHADVLSDGERARRTGLWDEGHRAQFTVAAALLRLVDAPLTARSAAQVVVDRSCPTCSRHHGRPRLTGTGLHVSITHSGATVAVAVSNAGEVGVDVQQVDDGPVQELSPLVLAESEVTHVAAARDFFTYWARKEALVKATGDGSRCRCPSAIAGQGPLDLVERLHDRNPAEVGRRPAHPESGQQPDQLADQVGDDVAEEDDQHPAERQQAGQ